MEHRKPLKTDRSPPPGSDEAGAAARSTAVAMLVHRMNGALNNASMALELALGDTAGVDATADQTLRTGLAAIAQASRAAALLAYIVHGRGAPLDDDGSYARDVREILRDQARSTGRSVSPNVDTDAAKGAAGAADLLVAELTRMHARDV